MDKNRIWVIGSVLVMVVVIVAGWFVAVQPQLAATAAAYEQRVGVEQTNATHEALLAKLKTDFKNIDQLKAELAPLDASVPTGTEIAAFVDQLYELSGAAGVTVTGLTVADAEPYTPVAAPVAAPVEGAPAAGSTPAPAPAPTDSAAPAASAAPVAGTPPVTNSLITATNFASLAVQVTVTGDNSSVLNFVNGLQTGSRLFLATGLSTVPSTAAADATVVTTGVDATISGLIYVLVPTVPGTPAGGTPAGAGSTEASGTTTG
ncbi:hypothetical protein AB4Y63_10495 [Leifsonia sp. YAF41]|uniref:hypothetical protein n=1 Tax=Leifsonia sp. YAF41 TaxID=3233086 RepID=UPI003F9AB5B8